MFKTASLAAAVLALTSAAAFGAPPLEATSLYTEKTRGCRELDLSTWSHPTRKVMERARVEIQKVELCNDDIYPIFTVALPGEPLVGVNDRFFNKLYAQMGEANGWHSFAFVDSSRGVIVTIDIKARRSLDINYDEFDIPQGN
jgi:hypothetical protein